MDLAILLTASAAFVLFLILHVILFRCLTSQPANRVILSSFLLCIPAGIVLFAWLTWTKVRLDFSIWDVAFLGSVSLFIYGLLVLQYIAWLFGMGEAAVRIRLLIELESLPIRDATLEKIYEQYNAKKILSIRLMRLANAGHVLFDGKRYRIANRILLLEAYVIRMMKRLFGILPEASMQTDSK